MFGLRKKVCKEGHLMDPSWNVCPVCIAPVIGWLVMITGEGNGRIYTIHEGKSKIGSGMDCELRVMLDTVSRQHAMISAKDGYYNICDLNSLTGTFVNNYQISNRDIIDGDILKFGDVEFKFKSI